MNVKHYEEILEQFKKHHPYLADDISDWRPRGDSGIRVRMNNGTTYDFHGMTNSIRIADKRPVHATDSFNEDEWREVFADRLAEIMCTKRISQQVLCEHSGLGKATINAYVNKRSTPSGYALTKLARALDCTIMDLTE